MPDVSNLPRWKATLENFRRASEPRRRGKSTDPPEEDIKCSVSPRLYLARTLISCARLSAHNRAEFLGHADQEESKHRAVKME